MKAIWNSCHGKHIQQIRIQTNLPSNRDRCRCSPKQKKVSNSHTELLHQLTGNYITFPGFVFFHFHLAQLKNSLRHVGMALVYVQGDVPSHPWGFTREHDRGPVGALGSRGRWAAGLVVVVVGAQASSCHRCCKTILPYKEGDKSVRFEIKTINLHRMGLIAEL